MSLFTDPRATRVVNLLGQFGLRSPECARLLRTIAEWYEPQGKRECETCHEFFEARRRSKRFCSRACKQVAYRARKGS